MLLIKLSIDIIWLPVFLGGTFITGFLLRNKQLKKAKKRIAELEKEMVDSHAEILELQKENLVLEEKLKAVFMQFGFTIYFWALPICAAVMLSGEKAVEL
jgi:hypothetical protein